MECKNCAFSLNENDNFCNSCGAKVIRNRLSMGHLWSDFSEQFLNYDNRFLKTFFGIFRHPEVVIGSYVSGTRKKYVNVLSYFALALTLSGIQIFIIRKFYPESLDLSFMMPDNVPQADLDVNWVYDYLSIIALINLPIYGLIARLTFIGLKKYNYTEHLTIMTYIVAQFSITNVLLITPLVAVFGLNFYILGNISNFFLILFTAYSYKRLYPLSLGTAILRSFLFLGILMVFLLAIGILQFLYMVMEAGGFENYLETVKAQQGISYIASSAINWTS